MLVGQLTSAELGQRLVGDGLAIRTGPVAFRLRCELPAVRDFIAMAYAEHPVLEASDFCDHPVELRRVKGLRHWVRPQIRVHHDHAPIFEPMPLGHETPLLEWALNWCVSAHAHQYVVIHAAAIERDGRAIIMPAPPGSGKSTLCAALIHRGWRLLSDELALLSLEDGAIHALARPVSLKNQSIDIIQRFEPRAVLSSRTHDTAKGTVALMKPLAEHVHRADEHAQAAWVIFPRWVAGRPPTFTARPKASALMALSRNIFNFGISGREGYRRLVDTLNACACSDFVYGQLDEAVRAFEAMAERQQP
jgi:HprK-related kinase A